MAAMATTTAATCMFEVHVTIWIHDHWVHNNVRVHVNCEGLRAAQKREAVRLPARTGGGRGGGVASVRVGSVSSVRPSRSTAVLQPGRVCHSNQPLGVKLHHPAKNGHLKAEAAAAGSGSVNAAVAAAAPQINPRLLPTPTYFIAATSSAAEVATGLSWRKAGSSPKRRRRGGCRFTRQGRRP
jgi:hypothetical protein